MKDMFIEELERIQAELEESGVPEAKAHDIAAERAYPAMMDRYADMADLTDEELDRARAEEARRLAAQPGTDEDALDIYLDLRASGWTPLKPVDPDRIEAREIVAARCSYPLIAAGYRKGDYDHLPPIQIALTAIKQTKAKFAAVLDEVGKWYDGGEDASRAIARIRKQAGL